MANLKMARYYKLELPEYTNISNKKRIFKIIERSSSVLVHNSSERTNLKKDIDTFLKESGTDANREKKFVELMGFDFD